MRSLNLGSGFSLVDKVTELRFRVQISRIIGGVRKSIQPEYSPVRHKKLAVQVTQKITKTGISFSPGITSAYEKSTSFFIILPMSK